MVEFALLGNKALFDEKTGIINWGNFRLNGNFGKEHQSKEKRVYLKFNESCNLQCSYCFQSKNNQSRTIDVACYYDILDDMVKDNRKIVLFGGEPLLAINYKNIIKLFERYNTKFLIYSNGCFDNEYLILMKKYAEKIDSIVITIDGIKNVHDNRRRMLTGSSYSKIIDNTRHMIDNGLNVIIQINVDKDNVDRLVDAIKDIESNFGKNILICLNRVLHSNQTLTEEDFLNYCRSVLKLFPDRNLNINSKVLDNVRNIILCGEFANNARCDIGDNMIFDFQNESVYACPHDETTCIGKFSVNSISINAYKEQLYSDYSKKIASKCINCDYFCYCGYGCYYDQDISDLDCKKKTERILRLIFDNFELFFSQLLLESIARACKKRNNNIIYKN